MNKNQSGFSLVEMLVGMLILSIISAAGFMLFISGESAWSLTDTQIRLHQSLRQTLQHASMELQESNSGQLTIFNNTGTNNTDIVRFSIPLCACGTSPMDENGDVKSWGAPLNWGSSGCLTSFPVEIGGDVKICHLVAGDPNDIQDLTVLPSAVNAHLSHGDWLGECSNCTPTDYTNRFVEYQVNASSQLIRRILNSTFDEINQAVVGENISDFQASLAGEIVTLTITASGTTNQHRQVTTNQAINVALRN
ncbi:MAG: prepilin-type N-terminal cleavage/methylation domain-containing protein [Candidatus Omnitrophota bacterium]|nr:prepilin-type N-terminal cleavage/methylation domain-containing protein [Candidatus Omnitrophota bacterium]